MGSKNNKPLPPFLRHPPLRPITVHPDPYGPSIPSIPSIRPPLGGFPPFEMLHHPEVLEQKLTAQHAEMQKLVTENLRLASTHETLRQELAAAKHELQLLHTHIGAMRAEKENQTMGLKDKIARIEVELKAADLLKVELQKARAEAQSLVAERQELIVKAQKMSQDLQRTHASTQQIPLLLSELESVRQELQHCRATYEYDRKYYHDHLESLKAMEKEYSAMANEVEQLRTEINSTSTLERTVNAGVTYGSSMGHNGSDATITYPPMQNMYAAPAGNSPNFGPSSAVKLAHEILKMPSYDPQRGRAGPGYDPQRGTTGSTYDVQRGGPGYAGYDSYRSLGLGSGYDYSGASNYDPASQDAQGQIGHSRNMGYGSAATQSTGTGYGAHR